MRTVDGLTSAEYLRHLSSRSHIHDSEALALGGIAEELEFMDAEIAALKAELAAKRRGGGGE